MSDRAWATRHGRGGLVSRETKTGRTASVPEENRFKKRNAQIAERLRTPAAPRIKEAAERRQYLLEHDFQPRACVAAIALEMEQTPRAVRYYLHKFDADPMQYAEVRVAAPTWDKNKFPWLDT